MDNLEIEISDNNVNSVVDGMFKGEKVIKRNDGYYIKDIRLSKDNYKKIERKADASTTSGQSKFSSVAKTILGTITFTLPLLAKSAQEDADKVLLFAAVTWNDDTESTLILQEEVFNSIVGFVDIFGMAIKAGKHIYDESEKNINQMKLNALRPLFPEDYKSNAYHVPSVIKIVDPVVRENERLCDGAIGWRETVDNLDVLCLYNSFVKESGLIFSPNAQCNAIYYENPHTDNQYIMIDELFEKMQISRAAELEQVASALGASYFRIEMVDKRLVSSKRENNFDSSVNATKYATAGIELDNKSDSLKKEGHTLFAESHFSFKRKPYRPYLNWFAENEKIKSLIEMRLGEGGNKLKKHSIEINCVNYSVMNSVTACNLDAVIKRLGVNTGISMKKNFEEERNQTMIYYIEF